MLKDIKGYEGLYQASDEGYVISVKNGRVLKGFINIDGYRVLSLSKKGQVKKFRQNRIIASTFIDNENDLPFVNHKDEIKNNDKADNLEWCTRSYNVTYGTGIKRANEKKHKPVAKIDKDGNVVIYSSLTLASIKNNIDIRQISQAVIRKTNCCGFEWKLATFELK